MTKAILQESLPELAIIFIQPPKAISFHALLSRKSGEGRNCKQPCATASRKLVILKETGVPLKIKFMFKETFLKEANKSTA